LDYNEYSYLYPPRPEAKIAQGQLSFYEKRGWIAQVKKNGTNTVIFARAKEVIFMTRHADENGKGIAHRMWKPKQIHVDFFANRSDKWNVWTAELLNDKTPLIKDHLYIYDQIVHNGKQLVGTNVLERHVIMHEMLMEPDADEEFDLYRLGKCFSIARNLRSGFADIFNKLKTEDEGLVLKSAKGKLEPCFKETSNRGWQIKSRIPHKNYSF